MWKYAAIRGLDAQMSAAEDAGARDLMRYAGSRASFEECRAAWSESFAQWRGGDAEELRVLRAITRGNRASIWNALCDDIHLRNARIARAVGKYAEDAVVFVIVADMLIGKDVEYFAIDMIIAGACIARRRELAHALIDLRFTEWDGRDDTYPAIIAKYILIAGDIEMYTSELGGLDENADVCAAARSGNDDAFDAAIKARRDWHDSVSDILRDAIASGNTDIVDEVRERDARKEIKYAIAHGDIPSSDPFGDGLSGNMAELARLAARKGSRAMCEYVLVWAKSMYDFADAREAMLNEAIARDFYWIVDLVLAHARAVEGPGAARPCAEHCAPCCAIMLR